jgi:hypothetical protein
MADPSFKMGILGGTFLTLLTLPWADIEKAIIVSVTGTATSFFVALLLRRLTRKKEGS